MSEKKTKNIGCVIVILAIIVGLIIYGLTWVYEGVFGPIGVSYENSIAYIEKEFDTESSTYNYLDVKEYFGGKIYKSVHHYKNLKGIELTLISKYKDRYGEKKSAKYQISVSSSEIKSVKQFKDKDSFLNSTDCFFMTKFLGDK